MARVEKYRIDFITGDNYPARVKFLFEGYSGPVINLEGSSTPFVLREFNTDENLFKGLRPQLAEVQIVSDSTGVSVNNFVADSETDIEVQFSYKELSEIYWSGFILQEDFSEEWQNQNHIIKITATEGLGVLKTIRLSNNGAEIIGMQTPWQIIQYATAGLAIGWTKYMVANNLYHDSMNNTFPNNSLTQCKIDPKTFEEDPTVFDYSYNVLEKINTSFSQTLFLYRNMWHLVRTEELYSNSNLRCAYIDTTIPSSTQVNRRFDILVGVNQAVKPIAPEMLRYVKRITKEDIIRYNFVRYVELIKNSTFVRGNLIGQTPTRKEFSITDWDLLEGDMQVWTAASSGTALRSETYFSQTGPMVDSYVELPQTQIPPSVPLTSKDFLLRSEPLQVYIGEKLEISVDHKFYNDFATKFDLGTFYVRLDIGPSIQDFYILNSEGKWIPHAFGDPYVGIVPVRTEYNGKGEVKPTEWNTTEVVSESIPANGMLTLWLVTPNDPWSVNQVRHFKSLKFEIINRFDGYQLGLQSQEAKFSKNTSSKYNEEYEIFIDDSFSSAYKGCIFELDGTTPTDNNWYRYRYIGERHPFHKQNLISKWSQNRYNRNKVDANFFGLSYVDAFSTAVDGKSPIGLINTVKFIDDEPNKIYAIVNLKEIDFAAGTWSATLQEVWDEDRDAGSYTFSYSAPVKTGTFYNGTSIGYTSPNQLFISQNDNKMVYSGSDVLTTTLTASASGLIQDMFPDIIPPATANVIFTLKKNGATLATNTIVVTTNPTDSTPRPFSVLLSSGSITINPYDIFELTYTTNVVKIQVQAGTFQLASYTIPVALDYDTYSEKYIYK